MPLSRSATAPSAMTLAPPHGAEGADGADALWRSPLPPFVRAHRFLERVAVLSEPEWREVLHRAHEVHAQLRAAGLRALTDRLVGHPQSRAFGALTRVAHDAAEIAGRRRTVPIDDIGRAAGLASRAASALALRDELAHAHGLVHYAPFVAVIDARPAPAADVLRWEVASGRGGTPVAP